MEEKGLKRQNRIWSISGNRNSALTLVELLIVVSIVSFLALFSLIYLRGQIFKGQDGRRKADIKRIQVAIEEYEKDNDCYPTDISCSPGDSLKPYLTKIPCDPVSKESYAMDFDDASCPSWYRIYVKLVNESDEDVISGIGPGGAYNYYSGSPNAPTPTSGEGGSGGSGGSQGSGFWGCKSGTCVPISSQTECSPNYTTSACGNGCAQSPECEMP